MATAVKECLDLTFNNCHEHAILRKDTLATRKRLIDTAETLFAERGIASTSLLDIAKTAGQKNRSALQYHFTNKEGLLDAVLDKHAEGIANRRIAMLDELESGADYHLYQVIEALVLPMATLLDDEDGGHEFLKIHSQLMTTGNYLELRRHRDRDAIDTQRLQQMISQAIETSEQKMIHARLMLMGCMLVHGLADYTSQLDKIPRKVFLHTLIQAIVDLLQQSPDALSAPKK
jgi:AcrR family transcriptional regulator